MCMTLIVETLIEQERERVFDILIDLRNYGAWLPRSVVFRGTTSISPGPIRVGTTYREASLWGIRRGVIAALDRPDRVSYRQPMTLRPAWIGVIDVQIDDRLADVRSATRLTRQLSLRFQGPVRHFKDAVARAFRTEVERTHASLKMYAEAPSTTASAE